MSPGLILSALAPSSSPLSPQWHLEVPEVREGAESVLYDVLLLCPDTKHISHLRDDFSCLPYLSIPSSPTLERPHSLFFRKSFIFRLLILTWLLFVKQIIGRSQLLVYSFSGISVPGACCAAASMNPCVSQLEALVSLSPPLSSRSFAGSIWCWGCKHFRGAFQCTVMILIFGISFLLQVAAWLEAWESGSRKGSRPCVKQGDSRQQ